MSTPADRERFAAHHELLERARTGVLSDVERAALAVLLDRALLAVMTDEEVDDERTPPWWRRAGEAYGALLAAYAGPTVAPPPGGTLPRRQVGGADVTPIRAR